MMTIRRSTEFEKLIKQLNEVDPAFYMLLHVDDRNFLHSRLEGLPNAIQKTLFNNYRKEPNRVAANITLRITTDKINAILPIILRADFDMCEKRRRDLAEEFSRRMHRIYVRELTSARAGLPLEPSASINEPLRTMTDDAEICPENFSVNEQVRTSAGEFEQLRELNSVNEPVRLVAQRAAYNACASYLRQQGINPPKLTQHSGFLGALKRMQDVYWWRRQLRQLQKRTTEQVMALLGKVSQKTGKYCSDLTLKNRLAEKAESAKYLSRTFIVNQHQQRYSLKEISDKNVSNPTIRKGELMTRMRGTENLANELGHIGSFVTITCPSKYHCAYAKTGDRNPNWNGSTPYQAQQYLNRVWARIRAELARQEIAIYGLRVTEPQHDGTPHWHMVLFMEQVNLAAFKKVVTQYAMAEDGEEKGAQENRVKLVDIDPAKGSATGYLAKYISKNIDGQGIDTDIDGGDANHAAQRVEAWASCWGIRQFQQIGGVPVTPWRELRRLTSESNHDEQFEQVRIAADKSDWKTYTQLMGGVFCKRKDLLIRPYYQLEADQQTGLIKTSWFDNVIVLKLKGIVYEGQAIITRLHQWCLEQAVGRSSPLLGVL